jgi:hypothetical protein
MPEGFVGLGEGHCTKSGLSNNLWNDLDNEFETP